MNPLALELPKSAKKRLNKLRRKKIRNPCDYQAHIEKLPDDFQRRLKPEKIQEAAWWFEQGYSVDAVVRLAEVSRDVARDIRDGRFDENGRLPLELAVGQSYCEPHVCPGCGGFIRRLPCKVCADRHDIAIKRAMRMSEDSR